MAPAHGSSNKQDSALLDEIKKNHKKTGDLFVDKDFPANDASLYFEETPPMEFKWMRPKDIAPNPQLFDAGADRSDIEQGYLGDCWLLASLSCLSMRPKLLSRVVPSDQGFDKANYCGAFHFYFWRAGEWMEVIVDDQLPTHNGKLVFTHSKSVNEFWTALVEKAYAKIFGTFEALKGGNMAEAMEDFTGGLTEPYELNDAPKHLFKLMEHAFERDSMIGCSIPPQPGVVEAELQSGLIAGHAYSVTAVKKVTLRGQEMHMVRIRNPWGNSEWNGPWSDDSPEMKGLSDKERQALELKKEDDGEFWMSFKDFKQHYTTIEICNMSPDAVTGESAAELAKKKWVTTVEHKAWIKGSTAGGCRNNKETFHKNPQVFVRLDEADDDDKDEGCTLIVALYQKGTRTGRSLGKKPLTIGFAIYEISEEYKKKSGYVAGTDLEKKFFLTRKMTEKSPSYINSREIVGRYKLKPGDYVIVPSTFEANEQGNFMLRIYTEKKIESQALDQPTDYKPTTKPLTSTEKGQYDDLKKKFAQIAGEDMEVDAFELEEMMNSTDALKEVKTGNFSIDACRTMVAIYDSDMSGKLGFQEFSELWVYICMCKKVFIEYDQDKSGSFSSFELQDALKYLGYSLDSMTFSCVVTRYANRQNQIDFNDFVMIACKLRSTFERFDANKNGKGKGEVDLKHWVQLNMYS
ncbi:calpain-B-like isoform X2 [Symsagittifera roscoffensis]|uniref:calpain-B-like isoform X2 n=1 Tax=Symsagittifera roscoffensis TaxID=84072 RepID=UPI00307BA7FB